MASLALSIAGNALGGPIGGAIGGILGSYLDNSFILPGLLGGAEDVIAPKPLELSIQSAEEGAPMNFLMGAQVPATGAVTWLSELKSVPVKQKTGGKGGQDKQVVGYNYYVSVGITVSSRRTVKAIKIFAESKKLYDDDPDQLVQGIDLSFDIDSPTEMNISSPAGGTDLSVFRSGLDITVSGSASGLNDGTFRVVSYRKNASGASRIRIRNDTGVNQAAGASITLTQVQPKFLENEVANVTYYPGNPGQSPDPHIESHEGAGEVPGWPNRSHVVLEDLFLGPYGNRIPQFRFIIEADAGTGASDAIGSIMNRAGFQNSEFDVSEVSSLMTGFPVRGLVAPAKALQPLMAAYDIIEQENDDGLIRFFDRLKAEVVDIDEDDLRAHGSGEEQKGPIEVIPGREIDVPTEVAVTYLDLDAESQRGSQAHLNRTASHTKSEKLDLPIVLQGKGAEARAIAKRWMWLRKLENTKYKVPLPPKYMHLLENDVIRVNVHGESKLLLIQRLEVGLNYMMVAECVEHMPEILQQIGVADPPTIAPPPRPIPPEVGLKIIDSGFGGGNTPTPSPGPGGGGDAPGFIIAISNEGIEEEWQGARIYRSDDDDEFLPLVDITTDATIGKARTVLPNSGGGSWDRASTVEVEMRNGELESVTEEDVLNGQNIAYLGGEIIGFTTATLIADDTYELSGLLRGLRDTLPEAATHQLYEDFVVVSDPGIVWQPINVSQMGQEKFYKAVSIGMDPDEVNSQAVTVYGNNLRPFSPVDVEAVRSGSDIDISWNRRTRAIVRLFQTKPVYEAFERYHVDVIYPAGGSTVVRTIVVDDATEVTYSEAMKSADGVGATAPVDFLIYQLSDTFGRGRASELIELAGS